MATIKSFTSLEQSKKLAEILPIESADMIWFHTSAGMSLGAHCNNELINGFNGKCIENYPAWSLSALLNILKYPELVQTYDEKWSIADWTGQHPKCLYGKDTPIDACVEMIIKLHELKML